jgi:hypothetical protein
LRHDSAHDEQPFRSHSFAQASHASLQSLRASAARGLPRASSRAASKHASMQSRQVRMQPAWAAASSFKQSSMHLSHASAHARHAFALAVVVDVAAMCFPLSS